MLWGGENTHTAVNSHVTVSPRIICITLLAEVKMQNIGQYMARIDIFSSASAMKKQMSAARIVRASEKVSFVAARSEASLSAAPDFGLAMALI